MIRIRRLYGAALPADAHCIEYVQHILRDNFPDSADEAKLIPDMLDRPFDQGYRTVVLISERQPGHVTGFSLVSHFPEINSALLEFLAVPQPMRGGGIGSALYEATREYLQAIDCRAMYMEVAPDDPAIVTDPTQLKRNQRRLRFYEPYGVRPIVNTEFETPVDASPAPHLLFDGLGREEPLSRAECRAAMRLILTRKYRHIVRQDYIERVVESVIDDPVRIREPRYVSPRTRIRPVRAGLVQKTFSMVVAEGHQIHHVRDRGYLERPARVGAMCEALEPLMLFTRLPRRRFAESHILAVHNAGFVRYLKVICRKLKPKTAVYPYVFPIRRPNRPPRDLELCAGYYCIDTFTPLSSEAYEAAHGAVDTVLTAAADLLDGRLVAYAMCRPPGHHAERRVFGGFCYFNNAAIAAQYLVKHGSVAVLDIDFHHGNGTQDIFYERSDVLTLSIHGHPSYAYPYFCGFADELGQGPGRGFNRNYPLPESATEPQYMAAFERAIGAIERRKPTFLIVGLGLDTMKGDPTGDFKLDARAMSRLGRRLAELKRPTLVVQEGGYNLRNLKRGAAAFFTGMAHAFTEKVSDTF